MPIGARVLSPAINVNCERVRTGRARAALVSLLLVLAGCAGPQGPVADIAITGLEATTYINGPVTFTIVVVGGRPDSIELRRDGALFQPVPGNSFTWDTSSAPEGSYVFVARARQGELIVDSEPKTVIVDRTPPTVTLTTNPSASPLISPGGSITIDAQATDDHAVAKVELLDGDVVMEVITALPYHSTVAAEQGIHEYRARALDLAGNTSESGTHVVPVYRRQTVTLDSDPTLDGCIEAGYDLSLFTRHFEASSCSWTTTYSILHLFSFDRSGYPDAQVENATLRFELNQATKFDVLLAGVEYGQPDDAPPTTINYPFVSTVTEVGRTLTNQTYAVSMPQQVDVTELAQAAAASDAAHWQFRLRTMAMSQPELGGTVYFAEQGDSKRPTLRLELLVP